MTARRPAAAALAALVLACASNTPQDQPPAVDNGGQIVTDPVVRLECTPSPNMPVAGRASPFDSVTIQVGGEPLRICYGRPFAQGRTIFGGVVPWSQLWRTGANEPTILHLPFRADIAGLDVPAGSYSIYTIPEQTDWTLIINRATAQWGHPSSYTAEVEAQELGRTTIRTERLDQLVEQFTIRGEPAPGGADILLEWERTRARIPVRRL